MSFVCFLFCISLCPCLETYPSIEIHFVLCQLHPGTGSHVGGALPGGTSGKNLLYDETKPLDSITGSLETLSFVKYIA